MVLKTSRWMLCMKTRKKKSNVTINFKICRLIETEIQPIKFSFFSSLFSLFCTFFYSSLLSIISSYFLLASFIVFHIHYTQFIWSFVEHTHLKFRQLTSFKVCINSNQSSDLPRTKETGKKNPSTEFIWHESNAGNVYFAHLLLARNHRKCKIYVHSLHPYQQQ